MSFPILPVFNHYAFNHSTHLLLAMLTPQDLHALLTAIEAQPMHDRLAHMVRARIFVLRMHQLDRSLYFMYIEEIPAVEFDNERCNFVAMTYDPRTLREALKEIDVIQLKGENLLGENYDMVKSAIDEPDLALPPFRRDTVAPHCQTVYQVVLACQKISSQQEIINPISQVDRDSLLSYFFELLSLHIKQTALYLISIQDSLQHFAELTFRFMVYRNSVLALHNICPFNQLSSTMQLWKNALFNHYLIANQVFLEIAGLTVESKVEEHGRFTKELLRGQGYLNQYAQGVIDLSINEDIVAFCGHSKAIFGEIYSHLENLIIPAMKTRWGQYSFMPKAEEAMREWQQLGLKPSTIRKIIQELNIDCSIMKEGKYCRQDDFIETCARIHGLLEHSHILVASR